MPPSLFLLLLHTSQLSSPAPHPSLLPLLLPFPTELSRIRAYHQPSDTLLALGSCLLKHLAVVRGVGVKWEESRLGRRDGVEGGKPCFLGVEEEGGGKEVGEGGEGIGIETRPKKQKQIDFNTSHHGQVVVLVAATTTTITTTTTTTALDPAAAATAATDPKTVQAHAHTQSEQPSPSPSPPTIKVGIDVVQTTSPSGLRGYAREGWKGWVNIFSEIFSAGELATLLAYHPSPSSFPFPAPSPFPSLPYTPSHLSPSKLPTPTHPSTEDPLQTPRLRLFYTYWALKEAYLKMIGLGVVAPWVQELEFRNVKAPDVGKEEEEEEGIWGPVVRGVEVWRAGQRVRGVRVEVRGWGTEYVVATVVEGMGGWEGEGEGSGAGEGERDDKGDGKGEGEEEQGFPAFEEVLVERDILPFVRDKGD